MSETGAAEWATLAEGNAHQARKRVSADLLLRDPRGRVLVVDPTYKSGWDLPGGMVEANESPRDAATREVGEELGIVVPAGSLLLVEWLAPHGPWDDLIAMIFDGGTLAPEQVARLRLADHELREFRFVSAARALDLLRRPLGDRLERALDAVARGSTSYVERSR